jgi:ABC-type polar amino acid transport system ATPase subunit
MACIRRLTRMREVADSIAQLLSLGKTVLIITHDLELTAAVCSRIIQMEGRKGELL